MDIADICALKVQGRSVPDFAADDAILFLWATFPLLPYAFVVIDAWDFEYKTAAFVWIKKYPDGSPALGLGNYTRQNAEVCLLAKRGKGIERKSASVSCIVESPRMEHSRKPGIVRDRIVELLGDLPRIELFGREKIEGWDVWGNEAHQEALIFGDKIAAISGGAHV
jgi:site-specific DNA-methyltransferase (adenine-specific)